MSGVERVIAALALGVLVCLAAAPAAFAHVPTASAGDGQVPHAVAEAIGGDITELPDGLYEVDPARGPDFRTHGPDTAADVEVASHGQSLGPGDPERAPVCASGDYYQQVLYAYRNGSPNRLVTEPTLEGQLQASIRRMNAVLNEEALASGGVTADYRVLCDAGGEIRIDAFQTPPNATSLTSVTNAAKAAGYDDPDVDYTIFFDYDDPNYCGVGHYSKDESLSVDNVNNRGGDYGMTYDGCWLGATPMHENGHNEGAVQYNAPFSSGTGAHCWDENDVMCYADGGDLIPPSGLLNRCTDYLHFDCGYDTYFDASPESCEYLASHWNMGSRLNRFIEFGGPEAPISTDCPPPPAPDPDPGPVVSPPSNPGPGSSTPSPSTPSSRRLTNRQTLTDSAGASGEWRRYTFRVPRHSSRLVVTLECSAGCADQLDLYARSGGEVSEVNYDCGSAGPGSDETCRIRAPHRGTWHLGVRTAAGPGGSAYGITARYRR